MSAAPDAVAARVPRQDEWPTLPAWRSLLEERWQDQLGKLTELALAYHDAEGSTAARVSEDPVKAARLRCLLREAVAARRALSETEEALARLSDGGFGRCEQCSAPIPVAELLTFPEARYCGECLRG